jgi:[ribosomal protein S5]-alanine N-acetyltransferase
MRGGIQGSAPVLSDDRVVVRGWVVSDVPLVCQAGADPEILRLMSLPPRPDTRDAVGFVHQQHRLADAGRALSLVIVDTAGRCGVGGVLLHRLDVQQRCAEIGYWLLAPARGRGLASRAVSLLSAWALATLRLRRVDLYVEPDNLPSRRTAERTGFRCDGAAEVERFDNLGGRLHLLRFSRDADDAPAW